MTTVITVELTLDQVLTAVRRLPLADKVYLKKSLEADLDQRLDNLLTGLWADNKEYSEEEVAADVAQAIAQFRATRKAEGGS